MQRGLQRIRIFSVTLYFFRKRKSLPTGDEPGSVPELPDHVPILDGTRFGRETHTDLIDGALVGRIRAGVPPRGYLLQGFGGCAV